MGGGGGGIKFPSSSVPLETTQQYRSLNNIIFAFLLCCSTLLHVTICSKRVNVFCILFRFTTSCQPSVQWSVASPRSAMSGEYALLYTLPRGWWLLLLTTVTTRLCMLVHATSCTKHLLLSTVCCTFWRFSLFSSSVWSPPQKTAVSYYRKQYDIYILMKTCFAEWHISCCN